MVTPKYLKIFIKLHCITSNICVLAFEAVRNSILEYYFIYT